MIIEIIACVWCRANQDLEQNRIQLERQTAAIQREKDALQQEARNLAQRLEAIIHDKFIPKSHMDADTPIDKTLNFLHAFIAVCCCCCCLSDHV